MVIMKKILIAVMLMTIGANADMCGYNFNTSSKYMDKALYSEGDMKISYIEMAIQAAIDAKYSCGDDRKESIQNGIDDLNDFLKMLKDVK